MFVPGKPFQPSLLRHTLCGFIKVGSSSKFYNLNLLHLGRQAPKPFYKHWTFSSPLIVFCFLAIGILLTFCIWKKFCTKSPTASDFLRQITAFRTPSSKKYPHVTWTFRSTCDGLANLPGYYSYLIQSALSPQSKACTVSHIDDLMVFSKTEETISTCTRRVQRACKYKDVQQVLS